MEQRRFDNLAREVASGLRSRRGLAKLLAGGMLAGLVGSGGAAETVAACRKIGTTCRRARQCCGIVGTVVCKRGRCRCAGSQFKDCDGDGRCEDLAFDDNHCGACNTACPANETCFGSCCRPLNASCIDVCTANSGCSACCAGFCDAVGTCQLR